MDTSESKYYPALSYWSWPQQMTLEADPTGGAYTIPALRSKKQGSIVMQGDQLRSPSTSLKV